MFEKGLMNSVCLCDWRMSVCHALTSLIYSYCHENDVCYRDLFFIFIIENETSSVFSLFTGTFKIIPLNYSLWEKIVYCEF